MTDFDREKDILEKKTAVSLKTEPKIVSMPLKKKIFRSSLIVILAIVLGGGFTFISSKLRNEDGLLGYRLVGFQLQKMTNIISPEMEALLQAIDERVKEAFKNDDPVMMEQSALQLSKILETGLSHLDVLALKLELSGRLMYWYGADSGWQNDFVQTQQKIETALQNYKVKPPMVAVERALAWNMLASGFPQRARAALMYVTKSPDDYSASLWFEVALRNQDETALKYLLPKVSQLTDKRTKYLVASYRGDLLALENLQQENYFPAEIELLRRLVAATESREEIDALLVKILNRKERFETFPILRDQLKNLREFAEEKKSLIPAVSPVKPKNKLKK